LHAVVRGTDLAPCRLREEDTADEGLGRGMSTRRILVPLDGRAASEAALPVAIERARAANARLYLLHVLAAPAPVTETAAPRRRAAVQKAEGYLAEMRRRIAAEAGTDVGSAVWSGAPAAAIVTAAELIDADLIVIARSGRTGPPRRLVGSVVERVLRGTTRPVLVVAPPDAVVDASLGDAAPLGDEAAAAPSPVALSPGPPAGTYLDALRSVQECERDALRVVTTVQQAAKSLERWQAVHVARAGVGFPKEVTMAGRVIDATSWPTARQLADTLAAWHSAAETARVAWDRLPQEERSRQPPPP
jgi:nucleotide-binding universal stress UspA family protein